MICYRNIFQNFIAVQTVQTTSWLQKVYEWNNTIWCYLAVNENQVAGNYAICSPFFGKSKSNVIKTTRGEVVDLIRSRWPTARSSVWAWLLSQVLKIMEPHLESCWDWWSVKLRIWVLKSGKKFMESNVIPFLNTFFSHPATKTPRRIVNVSTRSPLKVAWFRILQIYRMQSEVFGRFLHCLRFETDQIHVPIQISNTAVRKKQKWEPKVRATLPNDLNFCFLFFFSYFLGGGFK